MNDFSQYGTGYIKPKIDDDFSSKKNKKGNYNKGSQNKNTNDINKSSNNTKSSSTNPISNLQSMFPSFDKETIIDIYEHNNKNFNLTVDILRNLSQAEEPSKGKPLIVETKFEGNKITPGETPYFFGDENFDILKEHDDLYDQVSDILGSALDRNDIPEDELEDLLSMCEENVCYVIEEEQKLREAKKEENFEVDEVTKEVQEFILKSIQAEQKNQTVNTSLSNFPSLNASNWNEESYTSTSPYTKLMNKEYTKKAAKIQPKIVDKWGSDGSNNQVHVGNKPGSTLEIIRLCKHFPSLALNEIKSVYTLLDEDFESSLKFLREKYKEAYQNLNDKKKRVERRVLRAKVVNEDEEHKVKHDETVEQILKDYTYQEIRNKVQQLSKIKCILDRTAAQARGSQKYSEISRIENLARDQTYQLEKFSKASKKYVLEMARKNREYYSMDLHGLYWDEAREVIIEQINYLSRVCEPGKGHSKFSERLKNGQRYMEYSIITGKGLNSRNRIPILYNNLCAFLKEKNLAHSPQIGEGRVVVYIPID